MTGRLSAERLRVIGDAPVRDGEYVLYWMVAARRTRASFALDHAIDRSLELRKPLVVFEPLRADYRWASERLHAFVIAGMRDNAAACAKAGVQYFAYVEPYAGAGRGLLDALARNASLVVTDDQAGFFQPRMIEAAGARLGVRLEAVDGVGLLPVRAADRTYLRAVDFRRFVQKSLPCALEASPHADALGRARPLPRLQELPSEVLSRWPRATQALLSGDAAALAGIAVGAKPGRARLEGGAQAAALRLELFIREGLPRYDERKHPDRDAASGLSPYLHFGHIGAHEIWTELARSEGWTLDALAPRAAGQKEGFWGMSGPAEAFVDELVTWRELGHHTCSRDPAFAQFGSLPGWARATLEKHASDPRKVSYSREQLERAETHDAVWNAAQRELLREGVMHNYLRMLWGKKILEWCPSPERALEVMIELNNTYALDGRDPNSYSGIFWCLGRYDRPWAPERPIFGTIRYMSSDATLKKLRMKTYLERFSANAQVDLPLA
ncbi:MAG: deoxyribodipyrimidine photolyase [Myxococcales bacterium]|nr:deoxyribodipyrimidine photolyase [Myxococcales bacterium]